MRSCDSADRAPEVRTPLRRRNFTSPDRNQPCGAFSSSQRIGISIANLRTQFSRPCGRGWPLSKSLAICASKGSAPLATYSRCEMESGGMRYNLMSWRVRRCHSVMRLSRRHSTHDDESGNEWASDFDWHKACLDACSVEQKNRQCWLNRADAVACAVSAL